MSFYGSDVVHISEYRKIYNTLKNVNVSSILKRMEMVRKFNLQAMTLSLGEGAMSGCYDDAFGYYGSGTWIGYYSGVHI